MSTWIDEAAKAYTSTQKRQQRHDLIFPAAAHRLIEALVDKARQRTEKINSSVLQEKLGCQLQLTIGNEERFSVWKESFPSINLSVILDVYARRIKISYSKQEYVEARLRKYDDLFHLRMNDHDEVQLMSNGQRISVEDTADYLLKPFLSPGLLDKREEERLELS